MKTVYDVQQLLKRFGTIIYVGDRIADLELMESELNELYQFQFIHPDEYAHAILILKQEASQIRDKNRRT